MKNLFLIANLALPFSAAAQAGIGTASQPACFGTTGNQPDQQKSSYSPHDRCTITVA